MPIFFTMVKTRKQTEKDKANRVTKDSEATTPTKITNGRVSRKRVSAKEQIKSGEKDSKINSDAKRDNIGLRKFSVVLECITSDPSLDQKINTSVIKDQNGPKHKYLNRKHTENNVKTKKLLEQNSKKLSNCLLNTNVDKSNLKVKDPNELQNLPSKKKLQCQTRSNLQTQELVHNQSPQKTRCLIKLNKIATKGNAIVPVKTQASIPCLDSKRVVRLKRTNNVVQVKSRSPLKTQNCNVRLKKIANMESLLSTGSLNGDVIDNNNRKYVRKLSLTQSFNKSVFNENPEKSNVSNFEQEFQCGADNSKTETEIPKTLNDDNSLCTRQTRSNRITIKQIAKLSLKCPIDKTNKVTPTKLQNVLVEPELGSSALFNPVQNSTLLDLCSTNIQQLEKSRNEITHNTSSKNRSPSENLANKTVEIENLLSSLDNEEEEALPSSVGGKTNKNNWQKTKTNREETKETESNISNNNIKTNKFHAINQTVAAKALKEKSKNPVIKKKRFSKRYTNVNCDNIYEFFSQSQTSDTESAKHVDPTADVVKKLIQEGKVQLAINCKGKGKPKFKPKRRTVKQIKKIKQTTDTNLVQLKNKAKKVKFVETGMNKEKYFDMDHFQNDDFFDDNQFNSLNEEVESNQNISNLSGNNGKNIVNEQEGTFSRLARSVLINEAGRSNSHRKSQNELLKAVRNIISTPIKKKALMLHSALQTDLSPIVMAPPRQPQQQASSPWRVNDDAFLPKTFNFHRSSGNLPSFSSDFIPSTPSKRKSNMYLNVSYSTITTEGMPNASVIEGPLSDSIENMRPEIPILNQPSAISSFSSNDSNAENMTPPKQTPENQTGNDEIFGSRQFPNPLRALKYRSPLKSINILEVIHLNAYKHPNQTLNPDDMGVKQIEMLGFEENLDESLTEKSRNTSFSTKQQIDNNNLKSRPKENLFGFEDYLPQTEVSSQENIELDDDQTANEQNQTIHDKLQSLKKMKPKNEIQINVTTNSKYPTKRIQIFDDDNSKRDGGRQRGIKEMLCSTFLDTRPSTSKDAFKQLKNDKFSNTKRPHFDEPINVSDLFMDPEPETTFNESEAHRTYISTNKRKRRLKGNNFVMVLDSDESEEEDNSAEKHQLSRESDSSSIAMAAKKKRHCKNPKENLEMTKFVKEFNELCKKIESYELVVENNT